MLDDLRGEDSSKAEICYGAGNLMVNTLWRPSGERILRKRPSEVPAMA